MAPCHLRVYHGPTDENGRLLSSPVPAPNQVTLQVKDVLPLLRQAVDDGRTWLRDFCDDEITISADLYEVLLAYQHYRRPSA